MKLSIITLFILICSTSFGQINNYQNLLDTALSRQGALFVHSKPLKIIRLKRNEMSEYLKSVKEQSDQILDTSMFSQIILNTKLADTALWTDKELPNFLLVSSRGKDVSKKYALQKLRPTDAKQTKFYKKQINNFNSTETIDRDLSYFSRPVFDNSNTYAIVQWDNGHSFLSGGGGIILYQLQSDKTWKEFGMISSWKY